jgi:hypothetical protein
MPLPLAGMALSLTPVALSYMHGKSKGEKDPSKGGLGGSIASGMLLNPLSGIAYGLGHRHGRDKAVDKAMSSFATGAPIDNVTLREQDLKRDKRGRAFMNLLDTNENVRTLMGEKMPQFVNQYGGAYNPLAADLNQKMIPNLGYAGSMSPELADAYDRRQQSSPMDYRGARLNMVGQDPNMMYY